jgi:hypothetical protein
LDQVFVLNLDDREYVSTPMTKPASKEELQARGAQRPKPAVRQPTLLVETTTEDTGERKQMFGYTARRVITTVKQIPLVESGQMIPQETATDGWYIDLDTSVSCVRSGNTFAVLTDVTTRPGEPPQLPVLTFKSVGKRETGFALVTKEVHRLIGSLPDGSSQRSEVSKETQVTELATGPLDPALFEVPRNFRRVPRIRRTPVVSYWKQSLGWLDYYWARLKRTI